MFSIEKILEFFSNPGFIKYAGMTHIDAHEKKNRVSAMSEKRTSNLQTQPFFGRASVANVGAFDTRLLGSAGARRQSSAKLDSLPKWKRNIIWMLNDSIYIGLINFLNLVTLVTTIYFEVAVVRKTQSLRPVQDKFSRGTLIFITAVFFIDMILNFMVRDFNALILHYKMHLVEMGLQLVSYFLIYKTYTGEGDLNE